MENTHCVRVDISEDVNPDTKYELKKIKLKNVKGLETGEKYQATEVVLQNQNIIVEDLEVEVKTNSATNVTSVSAYLNGEVEMGDSIWTWFALSRVDNTPSCTNDSQKLDFEAGRSTGETFFAFIENLSPETRYFFRACGGIGNNVDSGAIRSFTTDLLIQSAYLTIKNSEDDESDEVSSGDDKLMGHFVIDIDNSDLEVDQVTMFVVMENGTVVNGGNLDDLLLDNIYLEDGNGNRVTDTEDALWYGHAGENAVMLVQFDNVDLEEGNDVNFSVFATIDDNVDSDTSYQFHIYSSDLSGVEAINTGDDIVPSGFAVMQPRVVEAANLVLSMSGSPSSRKIEDDEDQVTFATFLFDAGKSGEDIGLYSFESQVQVSGPGVAADNLGRLTNCRLYDEDNNEVELDRAVDGDDGFSRGNGLFEFDFEFNTNLLIERDIVVDLQLRCDVGSLVNDVSFTWGLDGNGSAVDAEGTSTNNDVKADVLTGVGGTMTIGNATLQVLEDASSPSTQLVVEGQEVILGVLELEAEDGDVISEDLKLRLNGRSEALASGRVYIEVDGERVGAARFNSSNTDLAEDVDVFVEDNESVEIVFLSTISSVGEGEDASNGESLNLCVTSVAPEDDDVNVVGVDNGNTVEVEAGEICFDPVYIYETVPSVSQVSFPTESVELTSGVNRELLRFSVFADENADLTLGGMTFHIEGSAAVKAENMEVEVFTSSDLTNRVSVHDGNFDVNALGQVSFKDDNTDNYLEVPSGQTYYFRVIADFTGVVDGDEITVALNEDEEFNKANLAASDINGISSVGNFVWSPDLNFGTTTDWFNGFEVDGLDADIQEARVNEN